MTDEIQENIETLKFYSGGPKFFCLSGFIIQSITDYNLIKIESLTLNRAVEKKIDCEKSRALVKQEVQELRSSFASIRHSICIGRLRNQICEKVTKVTCKKSVFV